MKLDIFNYDSFVVFLKDYYHHKNAINPNFNYTVWSMKLGLANVGVLTRILNGDRLPGDKVVTAFIHYFELDDTEKDYFTTLVRIAKESDPSVKSFYLHNLKTLRVSRKSPSPLLETQARNFSIWGTANHRIFDQVLNRYGFESILSYGSSNSAICLNGSHVYESALGCYSQFAFSCYAKRKDFPLAESEMFFLKLYASDETVVKQFNLWESPYELAKFDFILDKDPNHGLSFSMSSGDEKHLDMVLGVSAKPMDQAKQPNDVFGYNSLLGTDKSFKMSFMSISHFREFDKTTDKCVWNSNTELGKILDDINFTPTFWSYQPNFKAVIYPAESR